MLTCSSIRYVRLAVAFEELTETQAVQRAIDVVIDSNSTLLEDSELYSQGCKFRYRLAANLLSQMKAKSMSDSGQ